MTITKFTVFQMRMAANISKASPGTLLYCGQKLILQLNLGIRHVLQKGHYMINNITLMLLITKGLSPQRRDPEHGRQSIQVTPMDETRTKLLGSTNTLHGRQGIPKPEAHLSDDSLDEGSSQSFRLHSIIRKPQQPMMKQSSGSRIPKIHRSPDMERNHSCYFSPLDDHHQAMLSLMIRSAEFQ